mmetsp:Transcript_3653/g.6441  ORF Transcript_3653/g.6441 Transcript_3653/m.6441 type:complete len:89 (+) Transcript_3653:808-1074(+)
MTSHGSQHCIKTAPFNDPWKEICGKSQQDLTTVQLDSANYKKFLHGAHDNAYTSRLNDFCAAVLGFLLGQFRQQFQSIVQRSAKQRTG